MLADYRTAEGVGDDVVSHAQVPRRIAWLLALAAIVLSVGSFVAAVESAATVDVECGHALGACVVTTTRPLRGASARSIPLGPIRTVEVKSFRPKKNASRVYNVVFVTHGGEEIEIADASSIDRDAREAVKERLLAFFRDRAAPTLTLRYSGGQRTSLYMIPPLLVVLSIAVVRLFRRTTITFHWIDARVLVVRSRWPLRATSRSFRMSEVAGAELVEKDQMYNIALDLVSGERVLLSTPFLGLEHHKRSVDTLQALVLRGAAVDLPPRASAPELG